MKNYLLAIALLGAAPAYADELFSAPQKQQMMKLTLETFWGKAVDSQGKPIEPKDDAERNNLPISKEQAYYIIDKGAEAGLAQWCKLSWNERFELMMRQLRQGFETETQAAYAGALHGLAQVMMVKAMDKESCDNDTKDQVAQLIESDVKNLNKSLAGK